MDIVIKNGRIIDETGNPWFEGEIGVQGEKIIHIDKRISTEAERVIDAKGLIVAPGFIDIHTHSDVALLMNRSALNYIIKGVTTNVIGNCGISAGPERVIDRATIEEPHRLSESIECIIVNGTLVFEHGRFNEVYPGKVLRKLIKEH